MEIIDPYNLSENIDLKESIIDIKAKTKDNQTVIIEIQLCGNIDFSDNSIFIYTGNTSAIIVPKIYLNKEDIDFLLSYLNLNK
ncbi:PD-(D/E)XK nuclease family transposase [Brachyspira catarrhinii]|uniref:PD-(D/E)XK nuclease family transposase n=1 Tax=Brachyspira catarrhinii TaxID=2528966 RepID=UPI002683DF8B